MIGDPLIFGRVFICVPPPPAQNDFPFYEYVMVSNITNLKIVDGGKSQLKCINFSQHLS